MTPALRAGTPLLDLDDPLAQDPAIAGRKAATLARLRRAGYPVPNGLVLPVGSPQRDTETDDRLSADVASRLHAETVAVRSSSPLEDGDVTSAAGRYRTVLRVRPDAIDSAIHEVRASAGDGAMAVLLQPMVDARAAGVAFGADPVTGERNTVTISAVRGLGDAVADGSAQAELWRVTAGKAECVACPQGALTADQALQIARLVDDLGDDEGGPQDVEWAFDSGGLRLLQSRPITALPTAPSLEMPEGTWVLDRNRYPDGMTEFGASLAAPEVSRGLTDTFNRCGALIDRVDVRLIAGHPYLRFHPVGGRGGTPPPALMGVVTRVVPALRERCRRAARLLRSGELDRDIRDWTERGRARCRRTADELLAVDVTTLPDADLAEHFDRVRGAAREGLAIHFRLMAAHLVGVYRLMEVCRELWGLSRGDTLSLLAGHSPASDEPTRELASLARRIAAHPAARAALVDTARGGPPDVHAALSLADPDLAVAWQAWRRVYGIRTANDDPGSPTLAEIPGLVDGLLLDQVRAAASHRADAPPDASKAGNSSTASTASTASTQTSTAATAAAQRLQALRERLARRSERDRTRFETAWAAAVAAYPIREDNVLWALAAPSGLARRAAIEMGVRLHRAGAIDDPRDAVMLDADTLVDATRAADKPGSLRRAVARAKQERAWVATHPLPDVIGPPPGPLPDLRWLPRAARLVNEALQLDAPAPATAHAPGGEALLTGVAASAGRHTGPVRIVTGPEDFSSLRPGEVLVCAITDPAWSVLFGIAGAVVADGGGPLAHAAIIAREHAIPAVLGTRSATRDLADGQLVTVDGSTGQVFPADAPAALPSTLP